MRETMPSAVYVLIEYFLYILGKSYIAVFWLIKLACLFSKNIWLRNSVYFGNQIFYFSDIDLTIINDFDSTLLNRVKKLRNVFLMIGEVNVYKKSYFSYLSKFMNPFELARDPILKERIKQHGIVTKEDEIVFLLRCYQSDVYNLNKRPWLRVRKWRSHLSLVSKKTFNISSLDVLREIEILSNYKINCMDINLSNELIYPHLWMSENYSKDDLIKLSEKSLNLSPLIQTVFLKQLAWEFCGVMSQIEVIKNNEQVKNHYFNIVTILSYHETDEAKELSKSIISFCSNELVGL